MFHKISRPFNTTYKCFSVSMLPGNERQDVERGGKIIMPPSALDTLTRLNIEYPMIFKLTNRKTKRVTHCGVLEFVADEGKVYLPHWMMSNLILKEGASIHIESVSLPVATFSKFQPLSEDFLDISNAKAVLENCLRNFSCLTTGDVIAIKYNSKVYELCVLETKPGNAVIIIECDMNMNSDDVKYYVAELLEGSLKSSDKYVCIPFSWMKHRKTTDGEVLIKYPIETKSVTKRRVQNREESSHDWPIFSAELKLGTNSYKEATDYIKILNKISEQEESEIDESVPSTSGLTSETISNQTSDQESTASKESQKEINVGDSSQIFKRYFTRLRSRISSPANTVNVDQTVENDSPDTSSCSEEIVQYHQDENSSEQNCEKFTKGFILREALREVLGDNCKEIVDMLYAEYCERYRSFQKLCHDALQRCKTFEEMKKIFDDDNYGQGVSPSKRKKVTWSEVQNNNDDTDVTDEDDNIENDNDNPSDKIRGQARKFTLPPEYDPEDSKWMLKHREYKEGLVELIPNSHIYVDAVKLNYCKNVARDSKSLARMLLVEVFRESALSICSPTGKKANAFTGTDIRPGLDEHARKVLLKFVDQHTIAKKWVRRDNATILNTLRNKMQELRGKYR